MLRSFKKTALIAIVAVLIVTCSSVSARALPLGFWAYDPAEFVKSFTVDGDIKTVTYHFDDITPLIYMSDGVKDEKIWEDLYVYNPRAESSACTLNIYYLGEMFYTNEALWQSGASIDVSDIMPGAQLTFDCNYKYRVTYHEAPTATVTIRFRVVMVCWDELGNNLGLLSDDYENISVEIAGDTVSNIDHTATFTLPDGTVYISPIVQGTLTYPENSEDTFTIEVQPWDFRMTTDINMLYEESETLQKIDDKLGRMEGTLEEIAGAADKEKNEASSSGDDNVGALAGAIPDKSEGFLTAMGNLVSAMSYDGTEAKLTVPAITMPDIPGVMDSYKLSDGWVVDFGAWINRFPADIMEVVRVVLTIALVVYCFKELYDTIAYALTLRGGDR